MTGCTCPDLPLLTMLRSVERRRLPVAATTARVRFVYDRDDARLWYDADGSGAARPVLIAAFQPQAVVTALVITFF